MAQDDRGFFGNLPIAGILAILLFASGLVVQHIPLESDRPASNGKQLRLSEDGQIIEARLWQDPFDAIQRHREECTAVDGKAKVANVNCQLPKGSEVFHELRWLRGKLTDADLDDTLFLPVFIYGGPYAEDTEERRRYRYAVLSALRASHYEPVNGRAVGYVEVDGGTACQGPADTKPVERCETIGKELDSLLIPFERWTLQPDKDGAADAPPEKHVVIFWLKEEWFSRDAQPRLEWLFARLLPPKVAKDRLKLIGPNSFETVKALFLTKDPLACTLPEDGAPELDCRAAATVANPDGLIQCGNGHQARLHGACRDFASPAMTEPDPRFKPLMMSPDDRQLVSALIGELVNRKLELPTDAKPQEPCASHVALVVESDTNYGRSLERSVRQALAACAPDGDRNTRRLHVYRYFRGLDGKAAFGTESSKKSAEGTPRPPKEQTTAPQERAQGEGQFDYLLRVADAVRERNQKLTGKARADEGLRPNPQGIRAVLVLGTDVHDKLAVLHALREKMPAALFATNDLDAGLLQANRLAWTRNLIVASGYNLSLWHKLQQGAAPFRDTYQTATFFATRLALQPSLRDDESTAKLRRKVGLFEIGNGVAVRLKTEQHDRAGAVPYELLAGFGIAALALLGFIVVHSWCVRRTLANHWLTLLLVGALVASYVGWVAFTAGQANEEPWSLTAGVSAWPSEFIRFAVFLLAVYWLHQVSVRLYAGDEAIGRMFFNQQSAPAARTSLRNYLRTKRDGFKAYFAAGWLAGIRRAIPAHAALPADAAEKIDVGALWGEYRSWTSRGATNARVLLGLLCYLVLSGFIVVLDPPVAPVRGEMSALIDRLTIGAAWLATGALLLYTLDRVAVSTLFLRRLYGDHDTARNSDWENQAGAEHFCGLHLLATDNSAQAAAARSYVDLRLSAKLTHSVGSIVLYPFVLSLLLILARSRYFDNWVMPAGLLLVFGFGLLLVTFCAFALRHSAERIRQLTIEELNRAEIAARAASGDPEAAANGNRISPEQIRLLRDTASHLREGAFAPFAEQPIIRALVLPFGGAGLVSLVDWAIFM